LPPTILILGLHITESWHTYTQTGQAGSYQEALELDYFVKCEAAMLNGGRQPNILATRLLLCGDVTLATRAQYVVANTEHRFAGSDTTHSYVQHDSSICVT